MKLPYGWSLIKLGDLISLQRGYDLPSQDRENGSVPVIGGGGRNGFHSKAKAKGPGVVVGRSGAGFGTAFYSEFDFWPHNTGLFVTDFHGNFPMFVFYLLDFLDFNKYNSGGAQPSLNRNFIYPIQIVVPPLPEQTMIATLLSTWDQAIEKTERLINDKESCLNVLKQNLLTGKKRIRGYRKSWQHCRLSEVLVEHGALSTGQEEVYSVSVHKGLVNQVEHLGRSFAAKDTANYNLVKPGDIVYTKSPTGDFPFGIIKQSRLDIPVIVSPLYGVFTAKTPQLGAFLHFYFESPVNTGNYLRPIIQKGAKNTISITNSTFLMNSLYLPTCNDEIKAIAITLNTARQEIDLLKKQANASRQQKRGLMQKLLTGYWRVKSTKECGNG